ncbi:MAG: DHH family phosphoesterase [Thermoguttaceae bacterium]|jgi:phosphoesterase RecJ-like protein
MGDVKARKQWSDVDWAPFVELATSAKNVVVCGHVRPDGDTIGSCLALKRALEKLGKNVLAINSFEVPPALHFLDPNNEIRQIANFTADERRFVETADAFISVDLAVFMQLGPDAAAIVKNFPNSIAVIDHHEGAGDYGDVRCVDSKADSTGSLVFEAIQALGVELSYDIAFPLYVAIATDTGMFRFASTNSGTFERAAALTSAGVKVDEVYRLTNEQYSFGRFKLLGAAASNCERFLGERGAFMVLTQKDFAQAGAISADSEDLVNEPLSVAGTEVSIIAVEQKDGSVKVSFRSRCALDCSQLAREFSGGGHKKAAGATLHLPLDEAIAALKSKTEEYYARL